MEYSLSLYLADACALVDFYTGEARLPADLRYLIEEATTDIAIVATTVWEIGIKTALGKLVDLREPGFTTLTDMLRAHGFMLLPFDHATAEQAASLPALHQDPFDRALIAAARRTGCTVLTSDGTIARYGVPVRW